VELLRDAALKQVAEAEEQIEALTIELLQTQQDARDAGVAASLRHKDELKKLQVQS
jgi:hypothetical protein